MAPSRPRRRANIAGALALSSAAVAACAALVPAAQGAPRPNILMITVDDASPGNLKYMPNVRRLIGDEGVTLTNGVAPTPICVPARASWLTGQYVQNHGARTISGPHGGFESFQDTETLPVWLQRAGYDTVLIGKYINGYGHNTLIGPRSEPTYVPPGWTDWYATVGGSTTNYLRPVINHNGEVAPVNQYNSYLFTKYALAELSDKRRTQHPWFMMVNYVAPHAGSPRDPDDPQRSVWELGTPYVPPRYRDTYRTLDLPHTPDMFEADTSDKADASGTKVVIRPAKRRAARSDYQQRVESLRVVDDSVAQEVAALRRTGQLRNTVIVFASDNGYLMGQHNKFAKPRYFEEGQKVPMLLRGPGIPRDRTVATQVTNPDLATTIAAIAGAHPVLPQDGIDVRPLLRERTVDRVVPIQAWKANDGTAELYRGVRTLHWTYVELPDGEEELYNHQQDPYQLQNVAKDPSYRSTLIRMRALTLQYINCVGESCHPPKMLISSGAQVGPGR